MVLALALHLLADNALAATAVNAPDLSDVPEDRPTEVKKVTEIDFEALGVGGEIQKPVGVYSTELPPAPHISIIRLRDNFDDQTEASVALIR